MSRSLGHHVPTCYSFWIESSAYRSCGCWRRIGPITRAAQRGFSEDLTKHPFYERAWQSAKSATEEMAWHVTVEPACMYTAGALSPECCLACCSTFSQDKYWHIDMHRNLTWQLFCASALCDLSDFHMYLVACLRHAFSRHTGPLHYMDKHCSVDSHFQKHCI